jgi:RNA polymerase sigma factor (TIGR02999 family)
MFTASCRLNWVVDCGTLPVMTSLPVRDAQPHGALPSRRPKHDNRRRTKPPAPRPELVREETTDLLRGWAAGSYEAAERLLERVYPDLKRLVASRHHGRSMDGEVSDLVQETYLRLVDQRETEWSNRAHFFAVAARVIRWVLVDEAKRCRREKRGGGAPSLDLASVELQASDSAFGMVELDDCLERLAAVSPAAARVVELRVFAGLSIPESARVLGVGTTTVIRKWRFARAWLRIHLEAREAW